MSAVIVASAPKLSIYRNFALFYLKLRHISRTNSISDKLIAAYDRANKQPSDGCNDYAPWLPHLRQSSQTYHILFLFWIRCAISQEPFRLVTNGFHDMII